VIEIKETIQSMEYFDKLADGLPIFIAGSTWPADEFILKDFLRSA
jgi:hypothetical protein